MPETMDGIAVRSQGGGISAAHAACDDAMRSQGAGGQAEPGAPKPPRSFDDLWMVGDRNLQAILRAVATDVVAIALRGLTDGVAATVLRNMSKASAGAVRADLDLRGPTPLREVEAARRAMFTPRSASPPRAPLRSASAPDAPEHPSSISQPSAVPSTRVQRDHVHAAEGPLVARGDGGRLQLTRADAPKALITWSCRATR
jgi:hypothetical protein